MPSWFWVCIAGGIGLGLLAVASSGDAKTLSFSPAGKRILLLGDSLSVGKGSLGGQLAQRLTEAGATVTVNALGGRSSNSFVSGSGPHEPDGKGAGQLELELADGVDAAVILLGTNNLAGLAVKNPIKATKKSFDQIVSQLLSAGVEVYGIGSPHYEKRPEFGPFEEQLADTLEGVYGAGHFIDARPLTGNYYMHASGAKAKDFAGRLFTALTGQQ